MEGSDIIISLASNYQQEKNLSEARQRLGQILSDISYTRELWTEPIGHEGSPLYLNQLAYAKSTLTVRELEEKFKQIEQSLGRTEECRQQGIVPIDIDLLQFQDTRYHLRDWERCYVRDLLF
jgi:2-amino-4-hydroxy-6-hydroxymethyldihydropteridine diphosphokinase